MGSLPPVAHDQKNYATIRGAVQELLYLPIYFPIDRRSSQFNDILHLLFLLQEHIQEVLDKWTQIDDEIWAKVIVFERNRRVAKAYARAPVLTINGSDDGFDGMR